jgi:hypothetical protein
VPNLIIVTPIAIVSSAATSIAGSTINLRGLGAVDENSHFLLEFWHSFKTGNASKTIIKKISNATPMVEKIAPDFTITCDLKYIYINSTKVHLFFMIIMKAGRCPKLQNDNNYLVILY